MSRLIITFVTCFVMDNLLVSFLPIDPIVSYYRAIPNVFLICLAFLLFMIRELDLLFSLLFSAFFMMCVTRI